MIRRGNAQKSAGMRARKRSAPAIGHSAIFAGIHASVFLARYLLERFSFSPPSPPPLPCYMYIYARPRRVEKWTPSRRSAVLARAIEAILAALLRSLRRGCTRPAALNALSSSLIESPLYLRMPIEIYRRSRWSFRFNLL